MLKEEIVLLVKPTHECNLNCSYCYDRPEKTEVSNKMIDDETITKISKLASNTYKNINWTWHGGEPLLIPTDRYKTWIDIIKNNSELNNVKFAMQSNGLLLTDKIKNFMKEKSISYSLSYDFINKNKNRKFEKSIFNIDPYSEFSSINVIDYESSFKLIETYEKFKDLKREVSFNKIFLDKESVDNLKQYTENWKNYYKHYIYDTQCSKEDRSFNSYFDSIFSITNKSLCSESSCVGNFLSVNPDGDIFSCDRFGKKNASKYCFGNVNEYEFSFKEYKNSKGYKNLVEDLKKSKDFCKDCDVSLFCKGGCIANNVGDDGLIDASIKSENECYFTKEIFSFIFLEIFNLEKEEMLKINPFIFKKIFEYKVLLKHSINELLEGEYE